MERFAPGGELSEQQWPIALGIPGVIVLCVIAGAFLFHDALAAAQRIPLLMPGKQTLFQRVLTRPGALLTSSLMREDGAKGQLIPPLSAFYVYDRVNVGSEERLEIGLDEQGEVLGWVDGPATIEWKQALTVAFTKTGGRQPTMFFRDHDELVDLLESEDLVRRHDEFRATLEANDLPADFPVIAVEPETYIDPNRNFYLLPILGFSETHLDSGFKTRVMKVTAVTLDEQSSIPSLPARVDLGDPTRSLQDYRAGIVFVIDTTTSMGPYIGGTQRAIRDIYLNLKGTDYGGNLSFGLVAFRDSLEGAPGLEYVSEVVATLDDGLDEATFFDRISEVGPAQIASKGFREDAFSGVYDAIHGIDWSGYDGRIIVLVTDADARDATDELSQTKLGARGLRLLAQDKDQEAGGNRIAIYALHLLTNEGRNSHARAAAQYRELTRWGDSGSLYFGVENGSVEAFETQVEYLTKRLLEQVRDASEGYLPAIPKPDEVSQLDLKTALVGRAMQLAYLGRKTDVQVPPLINAWVADRDLANHSQSSLEVRVLITKNQLSDLQETLEAIFEAGDSTFLSEWDFFTQLRSASAAMARDQGKVNPAAVKRLADVGQIGEWLDGLPYRSHIMAIDETRWLQQSIGERQEVMDAVEAKINLYRRIHDDTDRWISLTADGGKGGSITTISLEALP